ncbi:hypothetical protein A3N44_07765 [Enterobacter hormaechei subsp. steigerwaltii]|nr:hypothetical protein A3N44_07765 [Enterobacter hormaechei subsp. steigerwaltii]
MDRADISGYSRSGNDLVITLHSGEVITLKNFYVTDAQGVSQLVLEESDGALWWIEDPTGAATYESIASTDALLAASGSDTGGAAAWPWVLGGLAVAGGIAGRIGGGGGDLFPVGEWRTEINRKFPVAARFARSDGVAIGIFQGNRAARLSGTGDGFAVR